jgi:hypothetical protein
MCVCHGLLPPPPPPLLPALPPLHSQVEDANSKASLALRQVEVETTLRGIHDGVVAQRETAVIVALQALCDHIHNDPAGIAHAVSQGIAQWMAAEDPYVQPFRFGLAKRCKS